MAGPAPRRVHVVETLAKRPPRGAEPPFIIVHRGASEFLLPAVSGGRRPRFGRGRAADGNVIGCDKVRTPPPPSGRIGRARESVVEILPIMDGRSSPASLRSARMFQSLSFGRRAGAAAGLVLALAAAPVPGFAQSSAYGADRGTCD